MTSDQFCYWLQGFSELNDLPPTLEQWASIREHLGCVFEKVTAQTAAQQVRIVPLGESAGSVLTRKFC